MAGIGCGSSMIKYVILIFNLIFFICAGLVLGFGIWLLVNPLSLENVVAMASEKAGAAGIVPDLPDDIMQALGYVAAIFGGLIFVISFFGCYGAWKESRMLLLIYAGLLALIFIVLLAICIALLVAKSQLHGLYADSLKTQLSKDYVGPQANSSNEFTLGWDLLQVELECCGVDNYTEFEAAAKWEKQNDQIVPLTCCKLKNQSRTDFLGGLDKPLELENNTCPFGPTETNSHVNKACAKTLEDALTPQLDGASLKAITVTSVTFIIMGLLIVAIVLSCCLASSIQSANPV